MAGDTQILREYLVALGFRVNEQGARKFDARIASLDKSAARLGKTLVGVGVATVTLTTLFARSMEKLYYSARYADTTVGRLQEMEFAAKNVGLEGGQMTASLKTMAASIRANPGLLGLLTKLGVPVKGRTMDQVMVDFVKATKSMPAYVANQYAGLFGMDPETLFNLQQGVEALEKAAEKRKQMAQDMGVDSDKAAEVAREYMNMWREVTERAGLFGQAIAELVMPEIKDMAGATSEMLKDWSQMAREINRIRTQEGSGTLGKRFVEGITGVAQGDRVQLSPEAKRRLGLPVEDEIPVAPASPDSGGQLRGAAGLYQRYQRWRNRKQRVATDVDAVETVQDLSDFKGKGVNPALAGDDLSVMGVDMPIDATDKQAYLAGLEKRYGLPKGLLDRVWDRESSRGKKMLSPAKAKGHFGFMDDTASEYGLKDPNDFEESADAAARKYRDLLKQYKGDARMAAAAYNWGDGRLAKYGLGKAPPETQKYMDAVAGPAQVTVSPEINIYGVQDPQRAAESVVRKQREVAGDAVRNLGAKVR